MTCAAAAAAACCSRSACDRLRCTSCDHEVLFFDDLCVRAPVVGCHSGCCCCLCVYFGRLYAPLRVPQMYVRLCVREYVSITSRECVCARACVFVRVPVLAFVRLCSCVRAVFSWCVVSLVRCICACAWCVCMCMLWQSSLRPCCTNAARGRKAQITCSSEITSRTAQSWPARYESRRVCRCCHCCCHGGAPRSPHGCFCGLRAPTTTVRACACAQLARRAQALERWRASVTGSLQLRTCPSFTRVSRRGAAGGTADMMMIACSGHTRNCNVIKLIDDGGGVMRVAP